MAAWDSVDLDRIVDYRAEYTAATRPEKRQISKDGMLALCPFHEETNPSFSVDFKTGKWHCFSEDDAGNFVTFWAKIHGYGDDTTRDRKSVV